MQYWIVFAPGVGGDGFANLLEHANNITPADGLHTWRIHKQLDSGVKFYGAQWATPNVPLRMVNRIHDFTLSDVYIEIVKLGLNTVVPTHYTYFRQVRTFPNRDIIEKNQVLIHLYSTDFDRVNNDNFVKNDLEEKTNFTTFITDQLSNPVYTMHIDIERVWTDWDYLNNCLYRLGIKLEQKFYQEYLDIIGK